MVNKKPVPKVKKSPLHIRLKFTKRNVFWVVGGIIVLGVIGFVTIYQYHRHVAIQTQEKRFSQVETIFSDFKANVSQALGASITITPETKYCAYSQQEFKVSLPFSNQNGSPDCYVEVKGTVAAQSDSAKIKALQIASAFKSAIQKTGIATTASSALPSIRNYYPNGYIKVSDTYFLYGQSWDVSSVRCDSNISTSSLDNVNSASYNVNSLVFTISCSQQSSTAFFTVRQ